jgi:hypothetical protein
MLHWRSVLVLAMNIVTMLVFGAIVMYIVSTLALRKLHAGTESTFRALLIL